MEASGLPRSALQARASALVGFARPIVGTVAGVAALGVLAAALAGPGRPTAAGLATALVAGVAVNVFVVGLAQLTVVEGDRTERLRAPADGGQPEAAARGLVGGSLVLAVVAAAIGGRWLLAATVAACVIGAAYAAPPLRLRRYPGLAGACAVAGRGVVANVLVYAHLALPAGAPLRLPAAVVVLTAAAAVVVLVLGGLAGLPEAQSEPGAGTWPARLGAQGAVALGVAALAATYTAVAAVALLGVPGLDPTLTAVGHAFLAGLLWWSSRQPTAAAPAGHLYRSVWVLLPLQYAVFAVAALPAAG